MSPVFSREILAAWICCGVIAVGGFMVSTASCWRSDANCAVGPALRVPGGAAVALRDRSPTEEFENESDRRATLAGTGAETASSSVAAVPPEEAYQQTCRASGRSGHAEKRPS